MKRFFNILVLFFATVLATAQNQKSFVVADKDGNSPLVESLIFQKDASDEKFSWKTSTESDGYLASRDIRNLKFIARTNAELQTADSDDIISMLEEESGKDGVNASAIATALQNNSNIEDVYTADGNNIVVQTSGREGHIAYPMYDLAPMFEENEMASSAMRQIKYSPTPKKAPSNPDNHKIAIFNSMASDKKYQVQNDLVDEIKILFRDHGYTVEPYYGSEFSVAALDNVIKEQNKYDAILIFSHGYCIKNGTFTHEEKGMLVTGEECSREAEVDKFCYNGKYYRTHTNSFEVRKECLVYIGSCYGGSWGNPLWDSSKSEKENKDQYKNPYGSVSNLLDGILPEGNNGDSASGNSSVSYYPDKRNLSLIAWRGVNSISQAHAAILFHRLLNDGITMTDALKSSFLTDPIHNTGIYISKEARNYKFYHSNPDILNGVYHDDYFFELSGITVDMAVKSIGESTFALNGKIFGAEKFFSKFGTRGMYISLRPLVPGYDLQYERNYLQIDNSQENTIVFGLNFQITADTPEGVYELFFVPKGSPKLIRAKKPIYIVLSSKFGDNYALPTWSDEDNQFPEIQDASGTRVEEMEVAAGTTKEFTIVGYPGHTFYPTVMNSDIAQLSIEGNRLKVMGMSEGKTYARVTDMNNKLFFIFDITVTKETLTDNHEYVDLGLPSGTLWATCNVGATKPEEYGLYFAWGETEPKDDYSWGTYKWCNSSQYSLTKYCTDSSYGNNGFTDNKTELDLEDDAAYVNWGSDWRMPSMEQVQELVDNCDWEYTTFNGVYGRKATSKINGKFIFLPTTGFYEGTSRKNGSTYDYWSRSIDSDVPCNVYSLRYNGGKGWGSYYRYFGQSVRPVRR